MTVDMPALRPDPEYLKAFSQIMSRIADALGPKRPQKPVTVCVAGGAAMHFYTGVRYSTDIDATILARVILDPTALQVAYRGKDGHARLLYFDTQYNDSFALLHEDAYDQALPIRVTGVDTRRLSVKLLTPLDLAVSKLARFSEVDQDDIGELSRSGLLDSTAVRNRAQTALQHYVGNLTRIKTSIEAACKLVDCENRKNRTGEQR